MGRSPSLARLQLTGNEIGESGAQGLGRALAASSTLTALHLRHCGSTAGGAEHLAEGVGTVDKLGAAGAACAVRHRRRSAGGHTGRSNDLARVRILVAALTARPGSVAACCAAPRGLLG